MTQFKVPDFDAAKPGQLLITIEHCYSRDALAHYIQVTPFSVGDLALAHRIAALPCLIGLCEMAAKEPWPDSEPARLLEELREMAGEALRLLRVGN